LLSLQEIVTTGLCIGCGLCQGIAGEEAVKLVMTPEGRERPVATALKKDDLERINLCCPGTRVAGLDHRLFAEGTEVDLIWGPAKSIHIGYAADKTLRHIGSTGGVLTALGQYLLNSGRVRFVLHVAASREMPMRSRQRLSFDAASILEGAGSRYGPAAPLVDFAEILDRGEPFAVIAKPCDISAIRNLGRVDPRVGKFARYLLTMVCGGASDLTKSEALLEKFGVSEPEVSLFRYRGYGNPGPTRVETKDGRAFEVTYQELWQDENTWMIQPRCKICADAIGEVADIVAFDVWPGADPVGEDEGFNGILVRSQRGVELFEAARRDGVIVIDRGIGFRDMDDFQPHQVRKKRAVWARLVGMRSAGMPTTKVEGLRIEECARENTLAQNLAEARGARVRARKGRLGEPVPVARKS